MSTDPQLQQPFLGRDPSVIPISNSELSTFKDCRRKWWLGYYRGLQPKVRKAFGPLALGSRVHDALEMYYTDNRDPVEWYKQKLEEERLQLLATEQDTTKFDSEGELGRIMLEGYVEWLAESGADAQLEVIGAEQVLKAPLFDGKVELQGKLDMRMRRKIDDVKLIVDHKTVQTFESITRTAHMNEQPMTYMLLEQINRGEDERCDGMIYNMLRKVKRTATSRPPFYQRIEVHFNTTTLRSFWHRIHGTISDMLHVRKQLDVGTDPNLVAYPRPTQDCTWKCEFYAVCPMFDDGSAAEEMIDRFYQQGDPYARYEETEK